MKYSAQSPNKQKLHPSGVTLVELSVVMSILIILVSTTTFSVSAYKNWKVGLEAGEDLKAIYQAQRLYLADHPTESKGNLTTAKIIPYLPDSYNGAMPVINDLDGTPLVITITEVPPVFANGYDPSPPNNNGVWDAGK
ncbi:type II secretion system protein [Rubritalea spongiae]|uniref:Type II secretion system protein n=1 Tax=Rubritalea spongiae TaxID=430797 RepID=A0ABW5E4V1_9BACT